MEQYELIENGDVKYTGSAPACFRELINIYGGDITVAELIERKISIEQKQQ